MTVIKVSNLSKKYSLGVTHTNLLSERLGNGLRSFYQRLHVSNSSSLTLHPLPEKDFFALRDISFEVEQGEVIGIIGRNGAGKSTLLKILSRITAPTSGRVELNGRVASLLEVGTGFHPELTGRENIFLNGAILGMGKAEIRRKFDEIVAFAEVEKFIDTPVKRYSSGMYVRLAFAVAAHLEPEILIIDEVLAVGDAAFQKKCLGKMGDVAKEGRTVLFVSHNMGAVATLCSRALLLQSGVLNMDEEPKSAIEKYLESPASYDGKLDQKVFRGPLEKDIRFDSVTINEKTPEKEIYIAPAEPIGIIFSGYTEKGFSDINMGVAIFRDKLRILTMHDAGEGTPLKPGCFRSQVTIPALYLRPGQYSVWIGAYRKGGGQWYWGEDIARFSILEEWGDNYEDRSEGVVNAVNTGLREDGLLPRKIET